MANKTNNKSEHVGSKSKVFFWIAIVSAVLAVVDHLYLAIHHYELKYGASTSNSLCNINETFNCSAVSASSYAEILGIPTALFGAAANAALVLLLAWLPFVDEDKRRAWRMNLLFISGVIAAASVVMGAISIFFLSTFCLFCIFAYLLSFISFVSVWLAVPPVRKSNSLNAPAAGPRDFQPTLIMALVGIVCVWLANSQISRAYGEQSLGPIVNEAISEWKTGANQNPQVIEPLVKGADVDKAKMTITEFADFRCSHCKTAAPTLKAFVSAHSDVRLQFQAWPLDGECNTSIPQTNGASCLLARIVQCAQKNGGKGWAAHDWIFERQERWINSEAIRQSLPEMATAWGVPAQPLTECSDSAETKQLVTKQAAVGSAMNLQGTPSIYVNGKKLNYGQVLKVLSEVRNSIVSGN